MITKDQACSIGKSIATAINNEQHGWFMCETGAIRETMICSIREHLERSAIEMLEKILKD